jgi:hypothetical protein
MIGSHVYAMSYFEDVVSIHARKCFEIIYVISGTNLFKVLIIVVITGLGGS